jgi:nucleoporin SEH1
MRRFIEFSQAHDAAISKLSWAHPEFGSIIASASFDRTVKVWEQVSTPESEHQAVVNGSGHSYSSGSSRWVERAVLSDAKGTVRSVEFAPHHFGLKLVSCFSFFIFLFSVISFVVVHLIAW